MEEQHKRRVRYKGTHPRKFEEKYKELNPEKYADTVAKVISKGSTPAGMHISIMVKEILDILKIQPGEQGVDATLGYGGHTRKMLDELKGRGHIYGLDVDPIEIVKTTERLRKAGYGEDIFTPVSENFANVAKIAEKYGKSVGIHAHNNQQLAFANTIEACSIGVSLLDATVSGMGRGAGNCYSELLLGFLRNPKFNIVPVLKFIEKHMVPLKASGVVWGCDVQYMLTGQTNQHPRTAIAFTKAERTDYAKYYTEITGDE